MPEQSHSRSADLRERRSIKFDTRNFDTDMYVLDVICDARAYRFLNIEGSAFERRPLASKVPDKRRLNMTSWIDLYRKTIAYEGYPEADEAASKCCARTLKDSMPVPCERDPIKIGAHVRLMDWDTQEFLPGLYIIPLCKTHNSNKHSDGKWFEVYRDIPAVKLYYSVDEDDAVAQLVHGIKNFRLNNDH